VERLRLLRANRHSLGIPAAFAAFHRRSASAEIFALAAADILRFPFGPGSFPFTLARRAFCAARMAARIGTLHTPTGWKKTRVVTPHCGTSQTGNNLR
jgi:hypothetical protein